MELLKKIGIYGLMLFVISIICYITFAYYFTFSDGVRSGVLSKFSHKGYVFKTWEGELNEGMGATKFFSFSVMDNDETVINDLKKYQGKYVKVEYKQRITTFFWWGDTEYYVTNVKPEQSPYQIR